MSQDERTPKPSERDEKVKIDLPFKDALRALLKTPPRAVDGEPAKREPGAD